MVYVAKLSNSGSTGGVKNKKKQCMIRVLQHWAVLIDVASGNDGNGSICDLSLLLASCQEAMEAVLLSGANSVFETG